MEICHGLMYVHNPSKVDTVQKTRLALSRWTEEPSEQQRSFEGMFHLAIIN